jgi:hypothetical protein
MVKFSHEPSGPELSFDERIFIIDTISFLIIGLLRIWRKFMQHIYCTLHDIPAGFGAKSWK